MKIDNSPARGMRDLLPADVAVRDHVLESISAVYRRYGYQRIETPALEHIDRLSSGEGGDNEKLIFEVLRRGLPPEVPAGTPLRGLVDLGLRYDLTVPLTRFYGNNHASLPMPFRSLQVGRVWRADRPQRSRYRQFYQCDIDMIGEPSVLAEAEQIEATTEALAAIGLTGTTVRLSDRRFLAALAADGPATATDLADRLPVTRQAIAKHLALLAEAGLVTAEQGERRRVRYRLRSAPMQVAQQFLAALARDWDSPLGALKDHLDRSVRQPAAPPRYGTRGHHG